MGVLWLSDRWYASLVRAANETRRMAASCNLLHRWRDLNLSGGQSQATRFVREVVFMKF